MTVGAVMVPRGVCNVCCFPSDMISVTGVLVWRFSRPSLTSFSKMKVTSLYGQRLGCG